RTVAEHCGGGKPEAREIPAGWIKVIYRIVARIEVAVQRDRVCDVAGKRIHLRKSRRLRVIESCSQVVLAECRIEAFAAVADWIDQAAGGSHRVAEGIETLSH